jgi:hypothetical protein
MIILSVKKIIRVPKKYSFPQYQGSEHGFLGKGKFYGASEFW